MIVSRQPAGARKPLASTTTFVSRKTNLYKTSMYLKFSAPLGGGQDSGDYTLEFPPTALRSDPDLRRFKRKLSPLALIAEPRLAEKPKWLAQQKAKLGKKYESFGIPP